MLDDHRRLKRCRQQLAQAEEAHSAAAERARSAEKHFLNETERIKGEIADLEKKCGHDKEDVVMEMPETEPGSTLHPETPYASPEVHDLGEHPDGEMVTADAAKGDTEKLSKKPAKKKASKKR